MQWLKYPILSMYGILPTFTIKINPMWVNIPNMDGMGIYVLVFDLDTRPFSLNAVGAGSRISRPALEESYLSWWKVIVIIWLIRNLKLVIPLIVSKAFTCIYRIILVVNVKSACWQILHKVNISPVSLSYVPNNCFALISFHAQTVWT